MRYITDTEGIMSELILVVDDEADIRDLLVFNLKREGYETAEASDGLSALEQARSLRPSLILLDVMLPRMDGLAVCRELARTETPRTSPSSCSRLAETTSTAS